MNSRYWKLCISYQTVRMHTITSEIMYLSNRLEPAGHPICRSQSTHLTTSGPDQGVLHEITRTVHFSILNFCTQAIYICTNLSLHLQTNQEGITCPVGSELGSESTGIELRQFPRSLPHLKILGANVIRLRTRLSSSTQYLPS